MLEIELKSMNNPVVFAVIMFINKFGRQPLEKSLCMIENHSGLETRLVVEDTGGEPSPQLISEASC